MKYTAAVIIFLLLSQSGISANADTIPHVFTGFQAHYGFIIPHSESIRDVSHTRPFGLEISHGKFHTSFSDWKVFNAYWISGLEASYFNFQNPKVLGSAIAISFFAEPVLTNGEKYYFSIRGGGGLSYHSKIYDPDSNPSNLFFGSRISFPLYVSARFKYRISERTFFTLSANYNHISNGGFRQPNKGMNFPTLALGLDHFQNRPPVLDHNYSSFREIRKRRMFFAIQALTTVRMINREGGFPGKACFVYGFNTRISKPLGPIYTINAGAEIIGDGYIRETLKRDSIQVDYKRFALTLGQDFTLGKVIFTQYFGFYLYAPNKARNPIYQKYELSYNVLNNFSFGIYIKAHAQVAESMGVTFNYLIFLHH
jgi:hypothetical protein